MGKKVYLAHLWTNERKIPTEVVSVSFDMSQVRQDVLNHAKRIADDKGYILEENHPTEGLGFRLVDDYGMITRHYLIKDAQFHGERAMLDTSSLHYICIKSTDLSDVFASTIDSAFSSKDSMKRFMDKRLTEIGLQGYTHEEKGNHYIVRNEWGNVVRVFALSS